MKDPIIVAERSSFGEKGQILAVDDKQFGANHEYKIMIPFCDEACEKKGYQISYLTFQKGPIHEYGVNGFTERDLLEILKHRLSCFQEGEHACCYNEIALNSIKAAITALDCRTKDRLQRHVLKELARIKNYLEN